MVRMNRRLSRLIAVTLIVAVVAASLVALYENGYLTAHKLPSTSLSPSPSSSETSNVQGILLQSDLEHFATDFTIANEKIFVSDGWGDVFCFNAQNGASVWNASVGSYSASGPTITSYQGQVYVGGNGGVVTSLNESTGRVEQRFTDPVLNEIDLKTMAGFTVAYGVVAASSHSGTNVYNASTGAFLWNSTVGVDSFYPWVSPHPNPYLPFNGGLFCIPTLTSINVTDGSTLWSIPGASSGPVLSNNLMVLWNYKSPADVQTAGTYYDAGQKLLCVNASSGAALWTFNVGSPLFQQPTISNGTVYLGAQNGYVYAVNLGNGALKWSTFVDQQNLIAKFNSYGVGQKNLVHLQASMVQVDPESQRVFWSVMVGNNGQDIYHGTVWSLDSQNGSVVWTLPVANNRSVDTSGWIVSVVLSNRTLYVAEQTDIYLVNASVGTLQLTRSFDHYVLPPVVSGDSVFVVADGEIIAFR